MNILTITKAEAFVKAVLLAKQPTLALAVNDPLYDLVVRSANQTKLAEILEAEEAAKANRSLLQTNQPADSYNELLANYFINRDAGSLKTVQLLVYTSTNTTVGTIPVGTEIIINNVSFKTNVTYPITSELFTLQTAGTYKDRYYFRIAATATEIGAFPEVTEGSQATTNFFPNTIAVIVASASGGSDGESNAEAYARGKNQISARNYLYTRAINAKIEETFPNLKSRMLVVGKGEPEMVRDLILTTIPKHSVRLFFSSPQALSWSKTSLRFQFNNQPNIVYCPYVEGSVSSNVGNWVLHPNGNYYIDIEVALFSFSNPLGFQADLPVKTLINTGNNSFSPIESVYTQFQASVSTVSSRVDETGDSGTLIHIGSHTDIYLKVPKETRTFEITVPVGSNGILEFPKEYHPIVDIEDIVDENGDNVLIYNLIADPDSNLRFSAKDSSKLFVNPVLQGTSVTVTVSCYPAIQLIQKDLDDPLNRVTESHTLVKTFFPIEVSGIVQVALDTFAGVDVLDAVQTALTQFFDNLGDEVEAIAPEKFYEIIQQAIPSIKAILSLDLIAKQYYPDGSIIALNTLPMIEAESYNLLGVSKRNIMFTKGTWEFVFIT
jgi:hypothetical protein